MSVRFKNGAWIVELYNPATKRKEYVRGSRSPSERAARKVERAELRRREGRIPGEESADQFASRWLEDFPRSPSTDQVNRERVAAFSKDFAGRPLRSITRPEAREWAKANPYRVPAVRAMFNDAMGDGLLDGNPFARLRLAQSRGRRDITVLTGEQIAELAAIARRVHGETHGREFAAMIAWAAYTLMRPGEVFAARYSHLDGDTYDLRTQFNSHLGRETEPKHGSTGTIYVPEPARQAVLSKPRRLGDDLIFRTKRGRQFRAATLHHYWQPVRAAFDRPTLDFYELRHFGAAYMLNELEIEPWVIAEQLRHTDGGALVVELYGHPSRRKAIDRIRRAFGGTVTPISTAKGESQGNTADKSQ